MPLHIYAEHLINIRTLTIQATLPSPSNNNTACTLSADGDILTLTHQGETASITLPVAVPAHASTSISIPAVPSKDLSFRVRLEHDGILQDRQSSETVIPWAAASLSTNVELRCKNCRAVLLPQGKIQTWKDLPSEGWAEMMEFWHCHKPNEPHNHEQQTDKKGYSAESKLAITPSVGLVNATSFILAAADCDNIKMPENVENSNTNTDLQCSSCNATVGILDATTRSYQMAKLALAVTSNTGNQQSFDIAKWLSCHLLSSMDNEGLRKFTVSSTSGSQDPISIWLFAPDLNVASTASRQHTPLRVVKVMWKPAPSHVQNARLDTQSMTEGEIEMPAFEFAALKRSLEESAILLPEGARRFLDWNVALLERFTVEDALLT